MKHEHALPIAQDIARLLQPHCLLINIAGSIRRKSANVNDIEIVCVPRSEYILSGDLFNPDAKIKVRSYAFMDAVTGIGLVQKGKPAGKYIRLQHSSGLSVDVFMTNKADYFRIYAIRTGSAEYAHGILARAWNRLGWVGTSSGLRLRKQCEKQGEKWKCVTPKPTKPPAWRSELELFEWLRIPFLLPSERFHADTIKSFHTHHIQHNK